MENKVHQMRICPVCGKNLFHKDIRSFKLAIKLNKKCVSCANSEKQFSNHIFAENDNYFDKSTSLKRTCSIYNKDISKIYEDHGKEEVAKAVSNIKRLDLSMEIKKKLK